MTEKLWRWICDDFEIKEATLINYAILHLCNFNWIPRLIYWRSASQKKSKKLDPNYSWSPALGAAAFNVNNILRARKFINLGLNLLLYVSCYMCCQINRKKHRMWVFIIVQKLRDFTYNSRQLCISTAIYIYILYTLLFKLMVLMSWCLHYMWWTFPCKKVHNVKS